MTDVLNNNVKFSAKLTHQTLTTYYKIYKFSELEFYIQSLFNESYMITPIKNVSVGCEKSCTFSTMMKDMQCDSEVKE